MKVIRTHTNPGIYTGRMIFNGKGNANRVYDFIARDGSVIEVGELLDANEHITHIVCRTIYSTAPRTTLIYG